jgi:hypothetical protein
MSLSSSPPRFAEVEQPTSGQRLRALRGREEIAQLTARLRSEHDEYESASASWSPEAAEKKKELRKARADTLVEIGAALTWLGEMELSREIERLPFEQKLDRLEAFLEDAQGGGSAAPSPEEATPPEAIPDPILPPVVEPFLAPLEPVGIQDAPRAASEPPRLASLSPRSMPPRSMPPRSMRPRSRRTVGRWPVRFVPSVIPVPPSPSRRVPWLVAVIAVQGLALAVLSVAVLRITPRSSESEPARAATSNATATAMAAIATPSSPPEAQPPAPRAAATGIPIELPVAAPVDEPRPVAAAQMPRRAVPPPRPPPRAKAAAARPPVLSRQPEIFTPDSL